MSDYHSRVQNDVCRIFEWYGFRSDDEYRVNNGYIDCVAFTNRSSRPFVGVEVHIQGKLDSDLKKLLDSTFIPHKIILTPDMGLISEMSKSISEIVWFPLPSKEDHHFEDYIKKLPESIKKEKYWYEGTVEVNLIQNASDIVTKFSEILTENNLNIDLTEKIIYTFISAGSTIPIDSKGIEDTNEYKFLNSLGIMQGLEFYWYDMEWGDKVRYSSINAEVPGIIQSRKMQGEPIAYVNNKSIINGVVKNYLEKLEGRIGTTVKGYSKAFCEVALMGSRGDFRPYARNYVPIGRLPNYIPPEEQSRLEALAANPFLSEQLWRFGKDLANLGLGVAVADDLIRVPYKTVVDVFDLSGNVKEKQGYVDEYLAWWVLYRGGIYKENMRKESNIVGVPWDFVLECIDETSSKGFTSRYLYDITGIQSMNNYMQSKEGNRIGGISDITVFKDSEFKSYCSSKIYNCLSNII